MTGSRSGFIETDVLLSLLSTDDPRADRPSSLLEAEPVVTVQVLSAFTAVARRKWRVDRRRLDDLERCRVAVVSLHTDRDARRLAARHALPGYDAMIVASALGAGCLRGHSENVRHGRVIDRKLERVDPFAWAVDAEPPVLNNHALRDRRHNTSTSIAPIRRASSR